MFKFIEAGSRMVVTRGCKKVKMEIYKEKGTKFQLYKMTSLRHIIYNVRGCSVVSVLSNSVRPYGL